jgi:transcriptional regulator with XRE-family HTH domain
MTIVDRRAVAARLRNLMTAPVEQVARYLHVSEAALRAAVHGLVPRPTVEVIVAASVYYGVDPAWIVAESYDPESLRAAAEGDLDATTASVLKMLRAAELDVAYDERKSPFARRRADEAVTEFSRLDRDAIKADQPASSARRRDAAAAARSRNASPREER